MRVVHQKKPLRRDRWSEKAVLETDIRIRQSRLRMKLQVFKTNKDLRAYWRRLHGGYGGWLGRYCAGVVNGLATEVVDYRKGEKEQRRMEVDPRYFAVMALIQGKLTMEYICHESVHAAYAYAKRVTRKDLWCRAHDLDEEELAYLTGVIASEVVRAINQAGL